MLKGKFLQVRKTEMKCKEQQNQSIRVIFHLWKKIFEVVLFIWKKWRSLRIHVHAVNIASLYLFFKK